MILDLIEKNKNITQREMSIAIGVAVSMVNNYLDEYEQKGYIKRKYLSTKTVEYFVSKKGVDRKKVLNISYLNDSLKVFKSASEDIVKFLNQVMVKGVKKILLYGAGEVAELLLHTIKASKKISLNVLGVIDDDSNKVGQQLVETDIISKNQIVDILHDGILISSYTNRFQIINNLLEHNYNRVKIIQFFD